VIRPPPTPSRLTPSARLAPPRLYADLLSELERRRRATDALVVRRIAVPRPRL